MKVWTVTLDVSTLNSTAFETVRGDWHTFVGVGSDPRSDCVVFILVLHPGIAVCG